MFRYSFNCQGQRCLNQERVKWPFCHLPCYYQSNHSKVKAILLSVLHKGTSVAVGLSPHYTNPFKGVLNPNFQPFSFELKKI